MAGFFGMFDPTKEGKGVSKNEPEKKRFFLFFEIYFRKLTKIVLLNVIYVLVCLPIVTIGPATAGLTYCMRNFAREEHADLSDFFEQFKKNFWQSILVWFVFTLGFAIIIFAFIFYKGLMDKNNLLGFLGFIVTLVSSVIFLFMSYYAYMIIVTFRVNLKQLIKDTFLFAIAGLGKNIITTLILAVIGVFLFIFGIYPIILPFFVENAPVYLDAVCLTLAFYLFFIPSLVSFIINFNIYPCVKKFMIDPAMAETKQDDQQEQIFVDNE